ncbi:ParB/RepB/Spo0J family partition protein [Candidatus Parcubacteria bacterium]|nr:MAG: ParB/RepB/Spo0J family partition protein [Candidatus Parcubacteria bacterium]
MPRHEDIILEIPYGRIEPDPNQPRKTFTAEGIAKLASSIEAAGLQNPIIVRPHFSRNGYYIITDGERRWRAIGLLRHETVLCVIRAKGSLRYRDPFIAQAILNLHRDDLNLIEEAETLSRLCGKGLTLDGIFQITGLSVSTIANRLRLLELPREIQEMVRHDRLPQAAALNLGQFEGSVADLIRLANKLVKGEEPVELQAGLLREVTDHGRKIAEAKLPADPEGLFRRISETVRRCRAGSPAILAFLSLSPELQERVFDRLTRSQRQNLGEVLTRFSTTSAAFANLVSRNLQEEAVGLGLAPAEPLEVIQTSSRRDRRPPVVPEEFKKEPEAIVEFLGAMFKRISGNGKFQVSFGKSVIADRIGLVGPDREKKASELAIAALRFLRDNWDGRLEVNDPISTYLLHLVADLRRMTREDSFKNFLAKVRAEDDSKDPIDLRRVAGI